MTPRTPSFADFDRPYRRGLVVGLSLAELFLILLFLLLLAAIAYSAIVDEEMDEALATNNQLSKKKAAADARAVAAGEARDEFADKLAQAEKAHDELVGKLAQAEKVRDSLAAKLAKTEKVLGNIIGDDDPLDLIVDLQGKVDKLEAQRDQLTNDAELGGKVREAAREAGISPRDVPNAISDAAQAQSTIINLQSQLADAEKERDILRERFEAAADEKGQYPPCWYVIVTPPNGKPRERALYIFDVRISDDNIFVKDIPAPTPEYARQKPTLPFNRKALNKKISFDEYVKSFKPLKDAAENGEVQAYPCKFYVKVWHATTNIRSYRRALEKVVESVFFTYPVKGEPWPH